MPWSARAWHEQEWCTTRGASPAKPVRNKCEGNIYLIVCYKANCNWTWPFQAFSTDKVQYLKLLYPCLLLVVTWDRVSWLRPNRLPSGMGSTVNYQTPNPRPCSQVLQSTEPVLDPAARCSNPLNYLVSLGQHSTIPKFFHWFRKRSLWSLIPF